MVRSRHLKIIKQNGQNKLWGRDIYKHCYWEWELVQLLWKRIWHGKYNMFLRCVPVISSLSSNTSIKEYYTPQKTYTSISIALLILRYLLAVK